MSRSILIIALVLTFLPLPVGAATFQVVNLDGAGEGFNDPSPRSPVAGNPGTTLGQQRLNAFQAAADAWGDTLESNVVIRVAAQMDDLQPCNANGGVLGQAGPESAFFDFPGAPRANTWYPSALADSLAGQDLSPGQADIGATFSSAVDNHPSCFTNSDWWYGIGSPAPPGTFDFYNTVLHELAHGLGVLTFVNIQTGTKLGGRNDPYMFWLEDHSLGQRWPLLSDSQRAASASDTGDLHWVGPVVVSQSDLLTSGRHPSGHVLMYAPNQVAPGSSVSHFDTSLSPNELMEPFLNSNLERILTIALFADLGWGLGGGEATPGLIFADGFETGDLSRWDQVNF